MRHDLVCQSCISHPNTFPRTRLTGGEEVPCLRTISGDGGRLPARRGTSIPPTPFTHPITSKFWRMGRTRTRSKNQRHTSTKTPTTESPSAPSSTTPSIPALITKAQSIIEQCDYDLATQFIQRILQKSPKNVEAREMLGVVQLETGLVQEARKVGSSVFFLVLH